MEGGSGMNAVNRDIQGADEPCLGCENRPKSSGTAPSLDLATDAQAMTGRPWHLDKSWRSAPKWFTEAGHTQAEWKELMG